MKKNYTFNNKLAALKCCHTKILALLLILCLTGISTSSYAQQQNNISIKFTNTAVTDIFKFLERTYGYDFVYKTDDIAKIKPITIAMDKVTISDVMKHCLNGSELTYELSGKSVLIKKRTQPVATAQQSKQIAGRVRDIDGRPVVGAVVVEKGGSGGTTTDTQGNFSLKSASEKPTLVFSFMGLKTKEMVYAGQSALQVQMVEDVAKVDEIIVTGYQEISKTRMTGSVESISAKDIANKGYTSVEDILKGQMAGVATMNISGRPGAQAQIRIRGINSLTGNSDPMWIVDGMPLQGDVPQISMGGTEFQETVLTSGIGNIPPDDIESITVLKDAAATAIYGSRAANGVIVVKTKRGSVGKSYINVQASYAVTEAPNSRLRMMNTQEKIAFERGIYEDFPTMTHSGRVHQLLKQADNGTISRAEAEKEIARLGNINTNWFDEIFRIGQSQNYNVSLSGGDETTQYYGSLSYLNQTGVMPNNKYDNLSANVKLTHDFNKWFRINFDIRSSLRNDRSSASAVDPLSYATFANPYERLYDDNGNYEYDRSYTSTFSTVRDGYMYDFNILEDLNANTNKSRYLSNQVNLKLEFKLMEGLMLSSLGTFANTSSHSMKELLPGTYSSKMASWVKNAYSEGETPDYLNNGKLNETTSRSQGWTIRNQIEFARGFGKHYINAYLGQEISSQMGYGFSSMLPEWSAIYGVGGYPDLSGIPIHTTKTDLTAFGSHNETQDRAVSFFFTGSYSYDDRYVISGSARLDGADIIGTANRFSPLWNVSGKWNIHNEKFMSSVRWINQLAIRGSYGFTGSIDRSALPFSVLYKNSTSLVYDGEKIFDRYTPANPSIKWQRKEDTNIGLDLSVLDNRINFTANYYNNNTRNLMDTKKVAASSGRSEIMANVASLNNRGWELSLKTVNVRVKDFMWSTSFNFAYNENTVTETYFKDLKDFPAQNSTFDSAYSMFIEGRSVKSFYGYEFAGINPADGHTLVYVDGYSSDGYRLGSPDESGRYVYDMDCQLTTELSNASRNYIGLSYPPITGGFSTQFNYKRFSLSANFTFMTGHMLKSFQQYNGGQQDNSQGNVLPAEANRWRKPGDITDVATYNYTVRSEYLYQILDFRYENGSYLKCNNISVGYNLPQHICDKLKLGRARFNINMSNVFTLTKYRGIDPETMGAFGYPSAKVYSFSLSIGI